MSVASEIQRINTNISNAYSKIDDKGGTLPQTQNSANLATAIDSIQTGGGGGADLRDYFTDTISAGNTNIGGYVNMVKNIPATTLPASADLSYAFRGYINSTIPLIDTSIVTNMKGLFRYSSAVVSIPLLNTSNVTNMNEMFYSCINFTTMPLLNTSNVTDMGNMFYGCTSLTSVPLLDTSNVTSSGSMFYGCTGLITIPTFNLSKVNNGRLRSMFSGCTSLSNESLNNIMASLLTNTKQQTAYKTLASVGLSSEQATICQNLSNYSAFTSAGWSTGY